MLDALLDTILPVFAVALIGYIAAGRNWFSTEAAATVNRFVFLIALPALLMKLTVAIPLDRFPWAVAFAYLAVEAAVIALGAFIASAVFKRGPAESFLLGMTGGFANHVFFVLPIATALYGADAARPIVAIIVFDSVIVFGAAIVYLDMISSGSSAGTVRRVAGAFWRNPPVLAMVLGMGVLATGLTLPPGVAFFLDFLGDGAAPASLFALGVILAGRSGTPKTAAPMIVVGLKLAVLPVLFYLVAVRLLELPESLTAASVLTAAGPCGAMPFVLALQFGVKADTIARAILYSTLASLPVLSILAGLLFP